MYNQEQARLKQPGEAMVVSYRFIAALTRGGAGGMPRPIEMHAHDPRRFISDMLAWVHQVGLPPTSLASHILLYPCTEL